MKALCLLLLGFFCIVPIAAQPWLKNLPAQKSRSEYTFFDYQQAFESYWAPYHVNNGYYERNGEKVKAPGWKQFKRWEFNMESRVDKQTGAFPLKTAMEVREEFEAAYPSSRDITAADWTSMGPTRSGGGYAGIGRLNCIAFHPTDLNTYWVGAAAGGLWMTSDHGATWTCMTDQNGVLAVSDIIIPSDYETSHTIYIATGDRDGWDNRSIGVLKSTDGGVTWNPTGLSFTIFQGRMTNRLLIDPLNSQVLIAATTQGVYRTIDGGTTWNEQLTPIEFIDMEYQPGNFSRLYGSTKSGEIYYSTVPGLWSNAYDDNNARRIELAVSPQQPDWVYAVASGDDSGLYGILKSTDIGSTYQQVFDRNTANLLTWASDGDDSGGQGWYDLSLAASPIDANILLVGGVNTWRSGDGGTTWQIVNHWAGSQVQAVHADKHNLRFRPNGDVFECNDGGVYFSTNNGSDWTEKTDGIVISQMYRLGVSQKQPGDVMTGLQDNGSKALGNGFWDDVIGGDGMECLIDYSNTNIQYGSLYYGRIYRTTNHWNSSDEVTAFEAGDGAWITPYVIDPFNPNVLYAGYEDVWRTDNRGDSWTQVSFLSNFNNLRSMAIAPTDNEVLYISDYDQLWKTTNRGGDWEEVTYNLPTGSGNIQSIAVKYGDPHTVWVTISGYGSPGVYELTNGSTTWVNISAGLPPIPMYSVVQNQQVQYQVDLYVATELGVYYKAGDADWVSYSTGLPNVFVSEIEIYYHPDATQSRLRAATYGRGLWESPVEYISSPMEYISCKAVQASIGPVDPSDVNQEILKMEIVTLGNLNPLNVSSFTCNTLGSTDPAMDISSARIFYTGLNQNFSTANPFGAPVISPQGTFTINGSQALSQGKNVFWLTYNVSSAAGRGNILDARFEIVEIGTARSPDVSDPAGNRSISLVYCGATATNESEYIAGVSMGDVNQISYWGTDGYQDFTSTILDLEKGFPEEIAITIGNEYSGDEVLIWVDWNMDGDFFDTDELVYTSPDLGEDTYVTTIDAPESARLGKTRMRIRLNDTDNGSNPNPCGASGWGEIEDYTLQVNPPDPCSFLNYLSSKVENVPGQYVGLGNEGTLITVSQFDDATSAPQDIGFPFVYHCQSFDKFVLNTNGFIKLGTTPASKNNLFFGGAQSLSAGVFNSADTADINLIIPFNHDLDAGTGTPEYRVHTSGVAPNRVCTIQWKDIREWTTSTPKQYDNMEFQVKLYETTNVIEFVYGDWTPSANTSDFKTAACGLKAAGNTDDQLLTVSKISTQSWADAVFTNANYTPDGAFNFGNPPDRPKPDAGRTYRFIPVYESDLAVGEIYALGESSIYFSNPQPVSVWIENAGSAPLQDIPVTLQVTGANTYSETRVIDELNFRENTLVTFDGFTPLNTGQTFFEIQLPDDAHLVDNHKTWVNTVTPFSCQYASDEEPVLGWGFANAGEEGIFYAKYHVSGTSMMKDVKAFITPDTINIGQTVFGMVLDGNGAVVGRSDDYVIQPTDLGTWLVLPVLEPPVFTDSDFYSGLGVKAGTTGYFALGVQDEYPVRPETFYYSQIDGSGLLPEAGDTFRYRFMIGVVFAPVPPVEGVAMAQSPVCAGSEALLILSGAIGNIQWQQSPDGTTGWENVTTGNGGHSAAYTTGALTQTTYYRAEITQSGFSPVYANTVEVIVLAVPEDAAEISGDQEVCQGNMQEIYFTNPIANAASYDWKLPPGASGSSTNNLIIVDFGLTAASGYIEVTGRNDICAGGSYLLPVSVLPEVSTPFITANGNILHSDAPAGNQWFNQDGIIPGATEPDYTATEDGEYYVRVTLGTCTSDPSNTIQLMNVGTGPALQRFQFLVYPNPVVNQFTIELPGNPNRLEITLQNSIGQIVFRGLMLGKVSIDASAFMPGYYLVKIEGQDFSACKKFVKV